MDVEVAHNIPVPPTPLRSIESKTKWSLIRMKLLKVQGEWQGLELIGQELMMQPFNKRPLESQMESVVGGKQADGGAQQKRQEKRTCIGLRRMIKGCGQRMQP